MPRYVKAYESLFDHELFRDRFSRRDAWLWLITRARWRDQSGGGLKRGQVLAGRAFLAEQWGWTEKEVRGFIAALLKRNMIEMGHVEGHKSLVLTICNYEKFQGTDENEGQNQDQQRASTGPAEGQHGATLEERKKDRREEEDAGKAREASVLYDELSRRLTEAAGSCIADPAAAPGLLMLGTPMAWLADGADLELDIIPALKAVALRHKGRRVMTWDYFTNPVAEAKQRRLAKLPAVEVSASRPMSARDASIERARSFMSLLNHGAPTT